MNKRSIPFRRYFLLEMNPVIRFLILSDVVWGSSIGLLGPIFALFIVDFIDGGDAAVAGIAAAIYLVTKSLAQIPSATIIDKIRGERDDFWILFIFSILAALTPLCYLLVHTPMQLYFIQFIYGIFIAFTFPSYMAIFTRHIDRNKEGTEWGIYFTLVDLGSAVTASIGGAIAILAGYQSLIYVVVLVSVIGVLMIYPIKSHLLFLEKSNIKKKKK
ncbi:MAG: MFS transporter [Patescibacteria group bacterium]